MYEDSFFRKFLNYIREIMVTLLIAVVIFFIITRFIQIGQVNGASMEDTYYDSDIVLINKIADDFERNEIIIFTYTTFHEQFYEQLYLTNSFTPTNTDDKLGEFHVKRVKGVAGDKIEIIDGETYINGKYISSTIQPIPDQEYVLGDNEYFVMGDNTDHSFDSRQHGPITNNDIFGQVISNR